MNDELPENLAPTARHWMLDPWFIAATLVGLAAATLAVLGFVMIWGRP
jgi:hypothetical protein